jgi:2-phosphoglycerate kinase
MEERKSMVGESRILLIGGASHVGKSTLAQRLAADRGWDYRATDQLARHPGRPWQAKPKQVPNHVADHYRLLSADELVADVLRHYREMVWPSIAAIVNDRATDRLILEGSALLPELVNTLNLANIAAIWLTATNEFLSGRINAESDYGSRSPSEKILIDQFVARKNLFNERIIHTVNQLCLPSVDV